MSKIAFLVPYAPLLVKCQKLLEPYGVFDVFHIAFSESDDVAGRLLRDGYEVVVARGGVANSIRRSGLNLTLVELKVSGFDIIRAVEKARISGKRIGVIAFSSITRGIDSLANILGVTIHQYIIPNADEIPGIVEKAIGDQMDVLVCGALSFQEALRLGAPAVFVESGEESILQAADEAAEIMQAIEQEKLRRKLFENVLDYVHDGVIAVDGEKKITLINKKAQETLKLSSSLSIGRTISQLLPGVKIDPVLKYGKSELDTLQQIAETQTLCSKVPIVVDEKTRGGLITFQEISRIQRAEAQVRNELYNKGHVARKKFDDISAASPGMQKTIRLAKQYAITQSNILIVGETGTGKEVFAQSIHNHSPQKNGPFVAVNCAALPTNILESELFGYVGGAFTGANREGKMGLFEMAHGGTIFLDEIAEMDYVNQSRLLRVIQEKNVMRLGSDRVIAVNTRVISATNKDLLELVRNHKFRADLYYRLNVLSLTLLPLRARREDIPMLLELLFDKYRLPNGRTLRLEAAASKLLVNHSWPGNIREIGNTVQRLAASCQSGVVCPDDVIAVLDTGFVTNDPLEHGNSQVTEILDALKKARGVQSEAAKLLGIDRSTLWRRMQRLGIG